MSTNTVSAEAFKSKEGDYRFPFECLDDTPGGSNLGRIEWCVELVHGPKRKGRYHIEKLYIWAKQTRDKRYDGKLFEIPCFTEALSGRYLSGRTSFTSLVWNVGFCAEHKSPVLIAYPNDEHSELVVNPNSSIMIDIEFE